MLHFDIDWTGLLTVADELQASGSQVGKALTRALRRTEATLRRKSSQGLRRELELRATSALRRRLKTIKARKVGGTRDGDSVAIWYGLNDLPVSAFKGRPRDTSGGASFKEKEFSGAFVGRSKVKGKQSIFKRVRDARLPIEEQLYPIEDKAIVFLEDEIFEQVETIFWQHFRRDLAARVRFRIGGL